MLEHVSLMRAITTLGIITLLAGCSGYGTGSPVPPTAPSTSSIPQARHSLGKTTGYSVSELATLGGTFGIGNGINNRGWISGLSGIASGSNHAALWRKGQTVDLGTLGGPNSFVAFPNKSNAGDLVGTSDTTIVDPYSENFCGDNVSETCLPFVWRAGTMKALPTLGGNNGQADGNNSRGDAVGFAETGTQDPSCVPPQVFDIGATLWDQRTGNVTQLSNLPGDIVAASIAVNDSGDVVGGSGPTCGSPSFQLATHAVLWSHRAPVSLPTLGGAYNNFALAINNRGDIAGVCDLPGDAAFHAVLWKNGKVSDLGTLPGDVSSQAFGVNMKDQIVGISIDGAGNSRAVLWQDGAVYDLNSLIPSSSNLHLTYGGDVNDAGVITGGALDLTTGNQPAFVASPQGSNKVVPVRREKHALPNGLLRQMLRGDVERFHFALIHR